jgi:hypothetical protein
VSGNVLTADLLNIDVAAFKLPSDSFTYLKVFGVKFSKLIISKQQWIIEYDPFENSRLLSNSITINSQPYSDSIILEIDALNLKRKDFTIAIQSKDLSETLKPFGIHNKNSVESVSVFLDLSEVSPNTRFTHGIEYSEDNSKASSTVSFINKPDGLNLSLVRIENTSDENSNKSNNDKPSNTKTIIVIIAVALLVVLILIVIIIWWKRRKTEETDNYEPHDDIAF